MGRGAPWGTGLLLVIAVASCSSSSGFHSSVPGSKPLTTLSSSELAKLCTESSDYQLAQQFSPAGRAVVCQLAGRDAALRAFVDGAGDAELQQACVSAREECLALAAQNGGPPTIGRDGGIVTACIGALPPPANCGATVAQLDACVSENVANLLRQPTPSCASLTSATFTTAPDGGPTGPGPACATYLEACPDWSFAPIRP